MKSTVRLTRRVTFSAGHRAWHPGVSEAENAALFGKEASRFIHGHNFVLEVTTEGLVQPDTGMVVNIKRIDDVLKAEVLAKFHLKSLPDEVPPFDQIPATLENLLLEVKHRLESQLPAQLIALRLADTPTSWAELMLRSEDMLMTVTRTYEFAASHRLNAPAKSLAENLDLYGKCNNPAGHGHNYILEVTVEGEPHPVSGLIVSPEALDEAVERLVVDRYDHRNLDLDVPELQGKITTSEVVAQVIFQTLEGKLPAKLHRVRLHETARNIFEVNAE